MKLTVAKLKHAVSRRIPQSPQVEIARAPIAILVTICIAVCAFLLRLNLASAVSILLLLTVLASIEWGVIQATAVSLTAVGCLDLLFTAPLFKFSVRSPENWVALAMFEVTALLVSRLSWKVRVYAQEQESRRQGISKLYQLSNAILLVNDRSSNTEQLSALMREFFSIESVEIWLEQDGVSSAAPSTGAADHNPAHRVFLDGRDRDSMDGRWSHRVLRLGTSPIGGMVLQGWTVESSLADAAASLIAVAVERARSAHKENRAEAARNTEQLRTAVLDALAHGFKTPLTAIQTASSGLLAIGRLGETQTELVEIIDQEVAMLANLTTRLLQTAALDAKEIRVRSSVIAPLPLLESVIGEQDVATRDRIRIFAPSPLDDVQADAPLLKLALVQLIDNAVKYSVVGTDINVTVVQDGLKTRVIVSNQGEPIPAQDLNRIFERYYRGSFPNRGPTGTGLGLSIVKKIAEAHGGDATASCDVDRIHISFSFSGGKRSTNG